MAGYVLNHPAAFYKIVLGANESEKLKRTLKMLLFIECGEGDPEMTTFFGDYLEIFFKTRQRQAVIPTAYWNLQSYWFTYPLVFDKTTRSSARTNIRFTKLVRNIYWINKLRYIFNYLFK